MSKIPWTELNWDVTGGCTKCAEGCKNCWALKTVWRLAHTNSTRFKGLVKKHKKRNKLFWTNKIKIHGDVLEAPLKIQRPTKFFVCSKSDLFHPSVPYNFITRVFDIMCSWRWPNAAARKSGDESLLVNPGHTYQVLTKRPERISEWLDFVGEYWPGDSPFNITMEVLGKLPKHIWIGTSIAKQIDLDRVWYTMKDIPAAVKYYSAEPLLETIYLRLNGWIDWVIIGCESGPGARLCSLDDIRYVRDQCKEAGVPCFIKQIPLNGKCNKKPQEWPEEFRIQEYPNSPAGQKGEGRMPK